VTLRNARRHLIAERRELLALCHGLGPAEWEAASLCAGWRVRDVVAHIIGGERDWSSFSAVRANIEAANALSVERRAARCAGPRPTRCGASRWTARPTAAGGEVRGPAADLIMAVSGRTSAARHVEGPGAALLLA
jgi:hypothetical protein